VIVVAMILVKTFGQIQTDLVSLVSLISLVTFQPAAISSSSIISISFNS